MLFAKRKPERVPDPETVTFDAEWVPKVPSKAAIFWSAFFDGPMGGLFGDVELPFSANRLFKPSPVETPHYDMIATLTKIKKEDLEAVFIRLDDNVLQMVKNAIRAAELEHTGHHETQST